MNYQDLIKSIDTEIQRLDWSQEQVRSHLLVTYGAPNIRLLTNENLEDFLKYLRLMSVEVTIPAGLFDQIERYLEYQAAKADGEASRLLMALEDLEINRAVKKYHSCT